MGNSQPAETVAALGERLMALTEDRLRAGQGDSAARLRALLEGLAELFASEPELARIWFIEAETAGTQARRARAETNARFLALVAKELDAPEGAMAQPVDLVVALLGGVRWIFESRVRRGEQDQLPGLIPEIWRWLELYEAPPAPLVGPPDEGSARLVNSVSLFGSSENSRVLRNVIEEASRSGYESLSIDKLAAGTAAAAIQPQYEDELDAFLAALEVVQARALAEIQREFRRAGSWPTGIKSALRAGHAFIVEHEDASRMILVEAPAAGDAAVAVRSQLMGEFEAMLTVAIDQDPDLPDITTEAICGAVLAIATRGVAVGMEPKERLALAAVAIYISLAPAVGAETACLLANSA